MAAVCEKKLPDGSNCDVQAIGRCKICGGAFCLTHQGRDYRGFHEPYVDMCAPYVAKAEAADLERRRAYQNEMDKACEYLVSGAAQTALLASGVQPVKISLIEDRLIDRFIFRQWLVKKVTRGHGWILGEFSWKYHDPVYGESTSGNYLTALLDRSFRGTQWYSQNHGLAPVQSRSERSPSRSYYVLPSAANGTVTLSCIQAEKIVKQLVGQ